MPGVYTTFDAGVLVREGLPSCRIDKMTSRLLNDCTMPHGLVVWPQLGSHTQERVVKAVLCIRVLGQLNVASGAPESLNI